MSKEYENKVKKAKELAQQTFGDGFLEKSPEEMFVEIMSISDKLCDEWWPFISASSRPKEEVKGSRVRKMLMLMTND